MGFSAVSPRCIHTQPTSTHRLTHSTLPILAAAVNIWKIPVAPLPQVTLPKRASSPDPPVYIPLAHAVTPPLAHHGQGQSPPASACFSLMTSEALMPVLSGSQNSPPSTSPGLHTLLSLSKSPVAGAEQPPALCRYIYGLVSVPWSLCCPWWRTS